MHVNNKDLIIDYEDECCTVQTVTLPQAAPQYITVY